MNDLIKIIYINGGTMDMGGISSYMMNYYRHFDRNKIQVDFIVHGKGGIYDDEIRKLGGKVYHVPTKKENYFKNHKRIKNIIKNGNYHIVHSHMDGMNGPMLHLAKQCGVKVRISHSHNTSHLTNNKLKLVIHEIARRSIPKYATELWACSKAAGKWLYGKNDFKVVPNAIEVEKYKFNQEERKKLRQELNIEKKFVIGHIGKFEYQKNHKFLIKAFANVVRSNKDALLMLIGDGSLKNTIQNEIDELGLSDRVLLLGRRRDVDKLMNTFDVFVLPSNFEGLPVVAVEAQTNGLRCVCSDTITREIDITGKTEFISLTTDIDKWVSSICRREDRNLFAEKNVTEKGYNIKNEALKLQQTYIDMENY